MKLGQSGIAITQVLMSMAAIGALTYIILKQSDSNNKLQSKMVFDQTVETKSTLIRTELANYLNCTASFKNLKFGTSDDPVEIDPDKGIFKGKLDMESDPYTAVQNDLSVKMNELNSDGVFISKMALIARPEIVYNFKLDKFEEKEIQEVLRVNFIAGKVDESGNLLSRIPGLGPMEMSKDFLLQATKDEEGNIISCFYDATNEIKSMCEGTDFGEWDDDKKKCEIKNSISKKDLIPLWPQIIEKDLNIFEKAAGVNPFSYTDAISTVKPPPILDKISCQCNSKRCSRVNLSTCKCALPACPEGWVMGQSRSHYSRNQFGFVNKACMYAANCELHPQVAGWLVRPDFFTSKEDETAEVTPPP